MNQIIVIDDQALEGRMISFVVEKECPYAKYRGQAYTAAEGIALAKKVRPDIVFLDITMPGMDGIEAIEQLREIGPDMHIVMLTAHDDISYIQRSMRAGANDYLLKPTRSRDIKEAVERWSSSPDSRPEDIIAAAKRYIEDHLETSLTLKDVADSLYLSPAYFSRLFCSRTHTTFRAWLAERRIVRAQHLLEETDLPVSEIASRLGYQEANSFTRLFRAITGISPTQYRKQKWTNNKAET